MRTRGWVLGLLAVVAGIALVVAGSSSTPVADGPRPAAAIVVHDGAAGTPFDHRLLGTNLPAWVGPARLADPAFVDATIASGATVVRMPGGSWSDSYDWLACENLTPGCMWDGSARPQDYAGFLEATGTEGMWTVNVNGTAQSAAALVAYFNGSVDDTRAIGVDRHGVDWQTVATWARLRAEHGHAEPVGVRLWEIGNEVWGARSSAIGTCAAFGWEDAWTCDGDLYVHGDADHDGFLAIRSAMRDVDSTIAVGAVGTPDQATWSGWGAKVIGGTAGQLDFYVLHHYGFDAQPRVADVLRAPAAQWPGGVPAVAGALATANPGSEVPVAVTEFNLVATQDVDDEALMTKAVNALYVADTIGQMASSGVAIANQWNLINGRAGNGTDYGMLDETSRSAPQYAGFALWQYAGDALVPVDGADGGLGVYATSRADGAAVVLVINRSAYARSTTLAVDSLPSARVAATTMRAPSLTSTELLPSIPAIAGVGTAWAPAPPSGPNVPMAPLDLGELRGPLSVTFAPWSISVLVLAPV